MTWTLAFDASTAKTVVALGRARELVCSEELQEGANQASTHLVPTIHAVLARAGIGLRELSLVAAGRGPGTFTGARVAVATAKGLAHGLSIPTLGVSTLAALAASAPRSGRVLALLDARRGEVHRPKRAAYSSPFVDEPSGPVKSPRST